MKKVFVGIVAVGLLQLLAQGQPTYSLQACIDTALARNISVQQSNLTMEAASVNLKQAKANLLPDVNGTLNHGINQGRSIDPFTNTYVNQSVNYANYGLSSGMVVYNGGNLQNRVKQNAYAYDASQMEWQQAKDNLTLDIILAYLQVLTNEDLLASAIKQKELSNQQLERLQILDSMGAIAPSQVTDVKGQLLNDEITILNIRNNLGTAKLALAQLMIIPFNPAMRLERMDAEESLTAYAGNTNEVFQTALQRFSLVKSVALRAQSAKYAWKASKAAFFPTLVIGGGVQTNYSSVAQNATGKISYNQQVRNNIFSTINVGISLPIFNSFQAKYAVRLADINVRNSQLTEEDTKVQLRQQIEQAYLNMTNAYDRYKVLLEQVAAYTTSFKAAEARFTAGVGTSVDYLVAKNNMDRATINLISAKYDFMLRKQVLDYYQRDESKFGK